MNPGNSTPFYDLGTVPWAFSQAVYHAAAELGHECLISLSPRERYVCIGRHQAVREVIDLDSCGRLGIPVIRRQVGGGAVLLDADQVFFQAVFPRGHPTLERGRDELRSAFLGAAVELHRLLGAEASAAGADDIVSDGRKISGCGFGEIGRSVVFVGNVILSFDFLTMASVLKMDDEKMRGKVQEGMRRNLLTVGEIMTARGKPMPTRDAINGAMARAFSPLFGELARRNELPAEVSGKEPALERDLLDPRWLFSIDSKLSRMGAEGTACQGVSLGPGSVLKRARGRCGSVMFSAAAMIEGEKLSELFLWGDFFSLSSAVSRAVEAAAGTGLADVPSRFDAVCAAVARTVPGADPTALRALLGTLLG